MRDVLMLTCLRRLTLGLLLTLSLAFSARADGTDALGDKPVHFAADEMNYDRDLELVVARGNVEIIQQDRSLFADLVSYNMKADSIIASGNITLHEPDGTVVFADYVELTGELKEGIARDIRMILTDRSRLAAARMERDASGNSRLDRAVYSACELCKKDPTRDPLWQLKAIKVTHDTEAKKIEYRDAWLEMGGVPVAYTPYFSHADPSVKRASGFLPPHFGAGRNLGATLTTPYYWDISPGSDLTFSPMFTATERVMLAGEYRERWRKGELKGVASITQDSKDSVRGHIDSKARMDIDDTWRGGLDLQRATDDTYMRRYGFRAQPWLISRPYVEGFRGRNYAALQGYSYQGQRAAFQADSTPTVLPMFDYNYVGDPGRRGGYWTIDTNALSLQRSKGTDMQRLGTQARWNLPYTAPLGDVYRFSVGGRTEGYWVQDSTVEGNKYSGFTGRAIPEASLDWRFPFTRRDGGLVQVIEPIIVGVISPHGGNPTKIPNEDSRDLEFDDTNLFGTNRFSGWDRVEAGPRINYGIHWEAYGANGQNGSVLLGQSVRTHQDSAFPNASGLEDNISDYVGRVRYTPSSNLSMLYRFRLSKDDLEARRNEIALTAGPPALRGSVSYMFVNGIAGGEFGDREQVRTSLSSALTRYWTVSGRLTHDLTENGGPLTAGMQFLYNDECFAFAADMSHNYTYDRDYNSGVTVLFRLVFKTLGEVQANVLQQ